MSKESKGGFSLGYVLLSFQTLIPSSGQFKADCLVWNKATPTLGWPEKILPIKEVGWRLATARRGEMNQNTPNADLLSGGPFFAALLIEWDKEIIPESNLRPRVEMDTQVWLAARDGDGRSNPCGKRLCLIPEESAWQQLWVVLETDWLQMQT